jgi:hypothetical protein
MTKLVVAIAVVLVTLATLAPPSFAQAPAPKVTINGLVDFVTSAYKNASHSTGAPGQPDITDAREKGWYSRERGVFTITGEVGRTKGVWAVELDFTNGAGNFNASSNSGSLTTVGKAANGTSANFDLDTDVQGAVETKWLYLETPVTGPGSLLPFIPVTTIARMGGQPARGHDYKPGVLLSGDIPGVTLETTWTPNIRSTLTYVQIGEALDRGIALNQKDDNAIVASVEVDIFKGLTVKPTFAYAFWDGGNCGTSNLGTGGYGGYNPNTNCPATTVTVSGSDPLARGSVDVPPGVGRNITRYYLGGDVRWTMGPWSFQPTFVYLLGNQQVPPRGSGPTGPRAGQLNDVPIRAFLFDTIQGFRTGPLLIETRFFYTPGVGANNDIQNAGGGVIRTYQGINPGFNYLAGWSEIWRGNIDYNMSLFVGRPALEARNSPSFDKYGRIWGFLASDYSLTPALTVRGIVNVAWTDTKVDTKGTLASAATGITPSGITTAGNPFKGGKEQYLGTELIAGLTYRFAPNMTFDLVGAALITGDALDIQRAGSGRGICATDGVPTCQSRNVYKMSGRFRITF